VKRQKEGRKTMTTTLKTNDTRVFQPEQSQQNAENNQNRSSSTAVASNSRRRRRKKKYVLSITRLQKSPRKRDYWASVGKAGNNVSIFFNSHCVLPLFYIVVTIDSFIPHQIRRVDSMGA
jgi:hypothetical protein